MFRKSVIFVVALSLALMAAPARAEYDAPPDGTPDFLKCVGAWFHELVHNKCFNVGPVRYRLNGLTLTRIN